LIRSQLAECCFDATAQKFIELKKFPINE
jgi:hypothetical protein